MELFRALAVLAEPPTDETPRVVEALELGTAPTAAEYTELFVFQLYPYASVYLGAEGMMGGEARDRVAGFWRALGEIPPAEADHLSIMLALYARLVELEVDETEAARHSAWRNARSAFLWEHLLSWLPVYLSKLTELAPPFYKEWGGLLMRTLFAEASALGQPASLPLHMRESVALLDPRKEERAEGFPEGILTPARFGGILARADLTRAARKLGIGTRIGERKFVLKALLAQDAPGVLNWLIEEADRWRECHRQQREALGAVALSWERRAEAASLLLKELASSGDDSRNDKKPH